MKNKFLLFLTICIFTIDAHCFETDAEISNQPVRSIILHSSWMYYKDEDGNTITKERISDIRSIILQYTITFSNYDGTELERAKFDYGKIPIYSGATPERPATAQYTYTFKGWMPELVTVAENAVYTADYDSVVNQYTVTFNNYDGTELQSSTLDYGIMPTYSGATPERPATAQYTYTFKGWMPELVAVTENAVYTADYDSVVNQSTNINNIESNSAVYKILRDGKVLIIHGGNACDMNGNDVKY